MNHRWTLHDRVWLYFLAVRCSWRFRWAHRPLCEPFRSGVLRLGPMWVCRSCTCLYASAGLTSVALWCWPELRAHAALCLAGVGIVTLAGSHPRLYKRLPRPMRDLLRAGMGSCFALIVAAGVQESWWAAAVTAVILFLFWRYYFALRRVRRARACDSCPDYSESEICPGCQDQVQAANRYEELASEYRMRRYVP